MGAFIREGQHWIISSVGIIFVIVGASKWLYDVLILNSFAYYKIYLVMIILGASLHWLCSARESSSKDYRESVTKI